MKLASDSGEQDPAIRAALDVGLDRRLLGLGQLAAEQSPQHLATGTRHAALHR
jgi:hypothetical protein